MGYVTPFLTFKNSAHKMLARGVVEGAISGALSGVGFGSPLRAASLGLKGSGKLGIPTGVIGMMISSAFFAGDVFGDESIVTEQGRNNQMSNKTNK